MDISYKSETWKLISWNYTLGDIKEMYNKKEITYNDYIALLGLFNLAEEELNNEIEWINPLVNDDDDDNDNNDDDNE